MRGPILTSLAALGFGLGLCGPAVAADYRLTLVETGTRDYYCTMTVMLENRAAITINDVNGRFNLLVGETVVGRTHPSSFWGVDPGTASTRVFESPSAPCAEVDGYVFIVGACRTDGTFQDPGDCAGSIETGAPIRAAVPR